MHLAGHFPFASLCPLSSLLFHVALRPGTCSSQRLQWASLPSASKVGMVGGGSLGWRMSRKRNTRSGHVFPSLPLWAPVKHLSLYRNSFSEFPDPLPLLSPRGLLVVMAPSSTVSDSGPWPLP